MNNEDVFKQMAVLVIECIWHLAYTGKPNYILDGITQFNTIIFHSDVHSGTN